MCSSCWFSFPSTRHTGSMLLLHMPMCWTAQIPKQKNILQYLRFWQQLQIQFFRDVIVSLGVSWCSEGTRFLWNVRNYTPSDTVSQPRCESSARNICLFYSKIVITNYYMSNMVWRQIINACQVCIKVSSKIDTSQHNIGVACSWVSFIETSHFWSTLILCIILRWLWHSSGSQLQASNHGGPG
jgi:hypothetical protein